MFFWNFLAFSTIQQMLAIWSLVSLPLQNPIWTCGSSWFMYCWILSWMDFEHNLASMWNEYDCTLVWTSFGTALLWDWNENWPFPVLWPLLSCPNWLACWVQHFKVKVWVTQSCPTLCNPMDCSLPGSSLSMEFSRQEYWEGRRHSLLQGIFLTQGLNLGLSHCRQILYHLSHQGSP